MMEPIKRAQVKEGIDLLDTPLRQPFPYKLARFCALELLAMVVGTA